MKKIILTGLFVFLALANVFSQQQENLTKRIDLQLEKVQEKLKLDNIQLLMVKEVVVKYSQQKRALHNQEMPKEEKKVQIRELNLKQEKELSQFLNEEQIIEFRKIMKEQLKKKRKERPRGKRNGNRRNQF
ncbi:hypothetical protein [Tenacibaculum aiptasiae]|uniref:hypothetical protein n=1 Tax=Tenacibaculum aiptasiae TaxID=426481 RepID=UPI003B5A708F